MSNQYTECRECINNVSCGISQPGFGCFAGEIEKPEPSEMVLCLERNNHYQPITEGSTMRIRGLVEAMPTLYGFPTVALKIEEVFNL
jgi:hypothetical protein